MTYCVGMLLDEGLILMADTRTNAGVDNFSIYKKLHSLCEGHDRQIHACTAGNLSVSQTAISLVHEGLPVEDHEDEDFRRTLDEVPTMFRAAQLVSAAKQIATRHIAQALAGTNVPVGASTLLGGRIGDGPPELYLIYDAGNFIQCKADTPFFQIGETKYGRPILDRGLKRDMPLADALKFGFLSFDSAMASNLGVARPIDIMVMPTDRSRPVLTRRVECKDEYFDALSVRWADALSQAAHAIPNPPFLS